MEDEMNDNVYLDRLEALLSHPETINPEDIDEWLKDEDFRAAYAMEMDVRRAVLGKNSRPDVSGEYRQFRRWVMQRPVAERQKESRGRAARFVPWIITAAAVILTLVVLTLTYNKKEAAKQEDIIVYSAGNELNDVTLTIGKDTLNLNTNSAEKAAKLRGMTLNKDKSISYNAEAAQEAPGTLHTLATPQGKTFQITLPDGTRVWLNAESRLSYPAAFTGGNRTVELQGEAYFEVKRDERRPFVVKSDKMTTTVLGTVFNMRRYQNDSPSVALVSGKVNVNSNGQSLILQPGHEARLGKAGQLVSRSVNIQTVIGWKDGVFYFDNMPFKEIMTELGRWYNMDVVFKHPKHLNDILHFHAERDWTVKEIINEINMISTAKIHIDNNILVVE